MACLSLALLREGFFCREWLGAGGPRHAPGLLLPPCIDLFYGASPGGVLLLLTIGVVASLALLLGLLTPLANLLTWLVILSLRNHLAWFVSEGAVQVAHCVLLALLFTPSGDELSLDARLGWRLRWPNTAAPVRAIQFLQILIYLESGFYKLMGMLWFNGTALKLAAQNYNFSLYAGALVDPWPSGLQLVSRLSDWSVLLWELTFPLWLFHRHSRRAAIAMGVVMHMALWLLFDIGLYAPAMLMLYLTYLPGPRPPAPRISRATRGIWLASAWMVLATAWAALPYARVYPEPSEASPVPGLRQTESLLYSLRQSLLPLARPLQAYCQAFGVLHRYNTFSPNPPRLAVFYKLADPQGGILWTDLPGRGRRYSWQVLAFRSTATRAPELLPILLGTFSRRYGCPRLVLEEWALDVGQPLSQLELNRTWVWQRP